MVGFMPVAGIVVGFIVLRRAGNFAFAQPTREVLFTVLTREDKYKTKSFIDTVVYRLGDQLGAWASALMTWAGLGTAIAWTAVPLALAWVANAWRLGRRQEEKARALAERYPGARVSSRLRETRRSPATPYTHKPEGGKRKCLHGHDAPG